MKIKLAILDKDQNYLTRLLNVMASKYSEEFEVYSFTDQDIALSLLESTKIDVFIAGDSFDIDVSKLPKRCEFAYFVESPDIDTVNDQKAICKFQKIDLIYKQILSMYSENIHSFSALKMGAKASRIIIFEPVSGGVGASTLAAACAIHFAAGGKKTFYLNLEKFGSSDTFFSAAGQFDMSDLIFAIKSQKTNLSLKLESCVRQDPRGVYFISQSRMALDMTELSANDVQKLFSELNLTGSYDYIIVDRDFSVDQGSLEIARQADAIVWVGNGSAISNAKLSRAYASLAALEDSSDAPLTGRLSLIYNNFSSKTGKTAQTDIRNIGGIPCFANATTPMILEQIAPMDLFEKIILY